MSTTSEFVLKKQVDKLMMLVQRQEQIIKTLVADIEMTESAGCAFAFDLAREAQDDRYTSNLVERAIERWDVAIAHLNELAKAEAEAASKPKLEIIK